MKAQISFPASEPEIVKLISKYVGKYDKLMLDLCENACQLKRNVISISKHLLKKAYMFCENVLDNIDEIGTFCYDVLQTSPEIYLNFNYVDDKFSFWVDYDDKSKVFIGKKYVDDVNEQIPNLSTFVEINQLDNEEYAENVLIKALNSSHNETNVIIDSIQKITKIYNENDVKELKLKNKKFHDKAVGNIKRMLQRIPNHCVMIIKAFKIELLINETSNIIFTI